MGLEEIYFWQEDKQLTPNLPTDDVGIMAEVKRTLSWMQDGERPTHGQVFRLVAMLQQQMTARQTAHAAHKPCVWQEDRGGIWYTSCNDAWEMSEGTPERSGYKRCPKCGQLIDANPWVEPEEPEEAEQPAVQP